MRLGAPQEQNKSGCIKIKENTHSLPAPLQKHWFGEGRAGGGPRNWHRLVVNLMWAGGEEGLEERDRHRRRAAEKKHQWWKEVEVNMLKMAVWNSSGSLSQ